MPFTALSPGTVDLERGPAGLHGTNGTDAGVPLTWDTGTSDADPGNGKIRANNASLASATRLYVDELSRAGSAIEAYLLALDDSTNASKKARIILTRVSDGKQASFDLSAVTDASGYVKLTISGHSGETSFTAGDALSLQSYPVGDGGRDRLSADRTYYVRADGSDSNTGLVNNAGGAWLTLQHASDFIADNLDLAGFQVIVQCAAGDYSKSAYCLRKVGPYHGGNPKGTTFPSAGVCPVVFRGDPTSAATAANYIMHSTTTDAVLADAGAYFALEGFDLESAAGSCIHTGTCASILLGKNIYGASTAAKIFAGHSSAVEVYANGWLRGNSSAILGTGFHGSLFFSVTTLTLLGNITVGEGFAQINSGELCYSGMTFDPGAFALTGKKFTIEGGGQIRTFTDDITYLPGSVAGIIYAGYYDRMGTDVYSFAANKNGVDQTFSSATATKVTFTNELRNTPAGAGFYDAANSKLFTTAGLYKISLLLQSKGTTSGAIFIAMIYKNGAEVARTVVVPGATGVVSAFVSYDDECVVGDFFEAYVYDASASTRTVDGTAAYTRFSGQRV